MSFHYEEFHGGWFNNQPQNAYVENNIVPYSLAKIKENDQHFIENWLAQTKVKGNRKQTSNNSPSIPELKAYISNVLKVCRDIKKLQEDLKENVSVLSSEEWGEKTALVNKWKGELNQMGSWKSEGTCELLNKKLAKRLSKRARLRRRKDKLKLQKIEEDLARTKRTGEINQWLNKMKEEIDNKKMEEKGKFIADGVLRDVIKRKADSRRCLALFDALKKLRDARQKSALGRGEKLSLADSEKFSTCIEKLECIWKFALDKYTEEENKLGTMLKEDQNSMNIGEENAATISYNEKEAIPLWNRLMFGSSDIPQRDFRGNLEHFVLVRSRWDQFICMGADGSRLPVGWVLPQKDSKLKWKQYLQKQD